MPYDTLLWGEVGAKDGLTGTLALGGQNHLAAADKITLLDEMIIWLQGLGSLSDTKPAGCALVPDNLRAQMPIYGPGGIDFYNDGWAHWLRSAPIKMVKGDKITGQCSSTNVNEGSLIAMDIAYRNAIPPWLLKDIQSRYKEIFTEKITITSAADITFNSGAGQIDTLASDFSKWSDPEGEFEILGVIPNIGAATFGGICNVSKLGGDWHGLQPGLIVNPLSAVTFNPAGNFNQALEPIPFKGDALPQLGMTATTAGAIIFVLLIGKL